MTDVELKGASVEFMIAEFNTLQGSIARLEDAKSSRVNFYLLIVAALLAGLPGVASNTSLLINSNIIVAVAAFALLILGTAVQSQLVHFSGAIVSLQRRAGRIRRWFLEADTTVERYLAFEPRDDSPSLDVEDRYLEFRGGDVIVLTVSAALVCAFVVALLYYFDSTMPLPLTVLIGAIAAVLAWLAQKRRIHAQLRRVETAAQKDVRFPRLSSADNHDGSDTGIEEKKAAVK
jgi:hypothetical protein